jgi:FkbM family methyltransferase
MISKRLIQKKNRLEASAREGLFGLRIFFPVRDAYQFLFNRAKLRSRRRMRNFYARYIQRGDLVFDVGANVGIYSEIFTELGAEVIAIEPNPDCCRLLERFARNRNLTVEACAAGETPGRALLELSDNHRLSSVNPDWRKMAQQSDLHRNSHWVGQIEVEMTTLDLLAKRYGIPRFVKIDVEGFDDQVMRGMTFTPDAITFEFNRLIPGVAARCLAAPVVSTGYEFNYVNGESMECGVPEWLEARDLQARLDALVGEDDSGDVIARRIQRKLE